MSHDLPSPLTLPLGTTDDTASLDEETTTLFRAFSSRLMTFLRKRFGEQLAQDATQEAFLRLHRARRDGARIDYPQSWVARVAEHAAIDHMRHSRPDVPLTTAVVRLVEASGTPMDTPEQTYYERQRMERLKQEVSRFSELERTCLRLRAEGKTFKEIGMDVGKDYRRVAELLKRATKKLAQCR